MDLGQSIVSDFRVCYLERKWFCAYPPPIRHAAGTTLSMADGHGEYWKWKGRETLEMPRKQMPYGNLFMEILEDGDYEPRTAEGLYDLERLQRATWGRLGHPSEAAP